MLDIKCPFRQWIFFTRVNILWDIRMLGWLSWVRGQGTMNSILMVWPTLKGPKPFPTWSTHWCYRVVPPGLVLRPHAMLLLMASVVCACMFKFHTSKCCGKIDFGPSLTKQQALVFTLTTTANSNYFMVYKCQSPLRPKINIPTLVWLTGSPIKLTKALKLPQKSHTDRKSN